MKPVLLPARALGVSAASLSHPCEVAEQRRRWRGRRGDGRYPQAVLRLGFGAPVAKTPRRDATDLLLPEPVGAAP